MATGESVSQCDRAAYIIDGSVPALSVFETGGRVVVSTSGEPRKGDWVLVEREGRKVMALYPCEGRVLGRFLAYQVPV